MKIGFSTGSVALGDFKAAISLLKERSVEVIELSSLRESELAGLISSLDQLDLSSFDYISFHAPSKLEYYSEAELISLMRKVINKEWPIIVHPDIISDYSLWQPMGKLLCLENMDKRKGVGKTALDMHNLFEKLPNASFCLDVAHAKQIDPTMTEASLMIRNFGNQLKQLHVSDVNTQCKHESLNFESILAYSQIADEIPRDVPVILESPTPKDRITAEIEIASLIFDKKKLSHFLRPYKKTSYYFPSHIYKSGMTKKV